MPRGHEIEIEPVSGRARVVIGDEVVADSQNALVLSETGLPLRRYFPREDIRLDLLEASAARTYCPFKGEASYFSAPGHPDIAWSYEDPLPEMEQIRDHIAFHEERL